MPNCATQCGQSSIGAGSKNEIAKSGPPMTKTGFIFANLFRRKVRTILTLLSVTCAFVLFGLLQAVNVLLRADVSFVGATRLIAQARVSMTQPLPMRMLPQLQAVPGVQAVTQLLWFGGVIGENNTIASFGVDPEGLRAVSPQWVMPEEQWRAFTDTRTSMIAGRLMAEQQGWKIGSKIPIKSNIFPQKDGSKDWAFDLVGIFDGRDAASQKQTLRVYLNHAYVDEANQLGHGNAGFFVLRLADPDQAQAVAQTVDKMFENSPDETKTQTEQRRYWHALRRMPMCLFRTVSPWTSMIRWSSAPPAIAAYCAWKSAARDPTPMSWRSGLRSWQRSTNTVLMQCSWSTLRAAMR